MHRGKYIVHDGDEKTSPFVYCVVQKVACSSIKTALLPTFDIYPDTPNFSEFQRIKKDGTPELRVHRLYHKIGYEKNGTALSKSLLQRDYYVFAFVRNPFDRLLSCYYEKLVDPLRARILPEGSTDVLKNEALRIGMPFDEFVEVVSEIPDEKSNIHFRSQHASLLHRDGSLLPDFLGRFERISKDFKDIANRINRPDLQLPHRLPSKSRPHTKRLLKFKGSEYRNEYNKHTRQLIERRYARDLNLFNYSF